MLKLFVSVTLIILFLLVINSIYAQNYTDSSTSNNNNNSTNFKFNNHTSSLSYKFEPFLLLNGTIFKDVPNNDKFSLVNFAIAAWINTNQTNQTTLVDHAHIVNKGGFNSEEEGKNMNYGIWLSKNGNIQGGFETASGKNFQVSSPGKYNDGDWHYVLLSYNGSVLRLDIDGKQVSTKNTNGAIPDITGDQPLRIGANSLENDKFYSGSIDEVRVWNRGLTDSEITKIYNIGTFSTTGQILYLEVPKLFLI
jgi:Concanavalin A-like lectin/glucanases superfamily